MRLLITQFPPTSCHFIPLWSKIFSAPCSQTPSVYVPPLMSRDKVSYPYRTTVRFLQLNHVAKLSINRSGPRRLMQRERCDLVRFESRLRHLLF
jgi:hypothetical protein